VIDTDKLIEALEAEHYRYTNDDWNVQAAVNGALWCVIFAVKKAARASRED
jgi:hypothetical protein